MVTNVAIHESYNSIKALVPLNAYSTISVNMKGENAKGG
jgi:hypothetical protein